MKILFIQLPLLDHAYTYLNGNIEYAPAVIAGYIHSKFKNVKCEMMPHIISNYCSDDVIIKYIKQIKPQIISFTTYLWNIERTLQLVERLKNDINDIVVVVGGPEVNSGSILFQKKQTADYYVNGEGEWFFNKLLNSLDLSSYTLNLSGKELIQQPQAELIKAEDIFDPVSGNMLNVQLDGTIYLELTRGCPYKCTYCYYSKNCLTVRELPFTRLTEAIKSSLNYNEIYILSPTLNRSKNLHENLSHLKLLDHNTSLHSEMRTDNIDKKLAIDLYDAGFRSLEIGLQTLNKTALKEIKRNSNIEKELKGMENLKNANIELKIGLIPGLPGDDPETFLKGIDKLVDSGFGEDLEIYPLMLLPGTEIYHRAIGEKIHFLQTPPYFITEGWNFQETDIKNIIQYYENATGYSHEIHNLPDFNYSKNGQYFKAVQFKGNSLERFNSYRYLEYIETNVFSFHIIIENSSFLYKGLSSLLKYLPENVLYNIIIYNNKLIEEKSLNLETFEIDTIYTRSNIYNNLNSCIFKYYQVTSLIETYLKARQVYSEFVPIFCIDELNLEDYVQYRDHIDYVLIKKNIYNKINDLIISIYSDLPEYVAFEQEDDQYTFYQSIGYEFIQMPYSFKTLYL